MCVMFLLFLLRFMRDCVTEQVGNEKKKRSSNMGKGFGGYLPRGCEKKSLSSCSLLKQSEREFFSVFSALAPPEVGFGFAVSTAVTGLFGKMGGPVSAAVVPVIFSIDR